MNNSPLEDLIWLTECELATLGTVVSKKRAPKSSIERHISISTKALFRCYLHGTKPSSTDDFEYRKLHCPRVISILSEVINLSTLQDKEVTDTAIRAVVESHVKKWTPN